MNAGDINQQKTMQLATSLHDQPWICTVYFVLHEGSLYWLSFPERRHSREVKENTSAAVAIVVKQTTPVVGVQAEGSVSVVSSLEEIEAVLSLYIEKYGRGKRYVQRYRAGENHHVLYRFEPREVVIFDEYRHPDNPQRKSASLLDI